MFSERRASSRSLVSSLVAPGMLLNLLSCAAPMPCERPTTSPPPAPAPTANQPARVGGIPASPDEFIFEAWIDDILLGRPKTAIPLDRFIVHFARPSDVLGNMPGSKALDDDVYCRGISAREVLLFIETGPRAIPELMKHVRDCRFTPWLFYLPGSSYMNDRCMCVGEVACYMIEAILRKDPYFTHTAMLYYVPFAESTEREGDALAQAATAYEEWYERCFDEISMSIVCPDDDLPIVNWDYRPDVCVQGSARAKWKLERAALRIDDRWTESRFSVPVDSRCNAEIRIPESCMPRRDSRHSEKRILQGNAIPRFTRRTPLERAD
jgi:hypothetical protein